ncbi:hypothetical protein UPYG_G00216630 [Umbra pygmaea]|uniref:Uncharacterized protein n=1 Tax=Umbra pygmaea TaxID=75934 RepID=A0ABD0WQN5_UMBPY
MFIYVKHGDDEQFLANINCPVVVLLQYMRTKMGLPDTELVDLCDDLGALKLLFQSRQPLDCANSLLSPRRCFTFCVVNRNAIDGAYVSVTPLVANPDTALLETLQTQLDSLESARLKQFRSYNDRRVEESPSQPRLAQTGWRRRVHLNVPGDKPSNRWNKGRRSKN